MQETIASSQLITYEKFKARDYFPALDGFRALAILLVLFHHVPGAGGGVLEALHSNARYGVSVFFVISGFIIATLFLRERERSGNVNLGNFYARRAFRLFPLYYVALALECFLIFGMNQYSPENQELFRQKFSSYLFYFSNVVSTSAEGPFFFAWSLAAEEQFYLAFGLLFLVLPPKHLILLTCSLFAAKLLLFIPFGDLASQSLLWRIAFSYQQPILIGVLAAYVLHSQAGFNYVRSLLQRASGFLPLLLLSIFVVFLRINFRHADAFESVLFYAATAVFLMCVLLSPRITPLEWRPLQHIGKISYGIYLFHMFVLNGLEKFNMAPQLRFVLGAVLVCIICTFIYRWFEKPLINYAKRSFPAATPQRTVAAPEPVPQLH